MLREQWIQAASTPSTHRNEKAASHASAAGSDSPTYWLPSSIPRGDARMRGLLPLLLTTTWASNPLFCADQTVTIRHRDSLAQERINIGAVEGWLAERLG